MRLAVQRGLPLIIVALFSSISSWGTDLLHGLTYQETPEPLAGSLVFLVDELSKGSTDTVSSASIYEFNLETQVLQKVVASPPGQFICSDDGAVFCVIFGDSGGLFTGTNVFLFSKQDSTSRVVSLGKRPSGSLIVGKHAFFVVDITTNGTMLLHYDFMHDVLRRIEVQERGTLEYERYSDVHRSPIPTDTIHFEYSGMRRRKLVAKGFYSFDAETGNIRLLENRCMHDEGRIHTKSVDGRYVFMQGINAPLSGYDLVSSPLPCFETKVKGLGVPDLKVLNRFPKIRNGDYALEGLSPCRRYAFVKLEEGIRWWPAEPWRRYTYFVVNVTNGATHAILKDTVEHDPERSVSGLTWVGSKGVQGD